MCVGPAQRAFLSHFYSAETFTIQQARDHSLIAVEFHILPTLPSENPTVVRREWVSRQYRARMSRI